MWVYIPQAFAQNVHFFDMCKVVSLNLKHLIPGNMMVKQYIWTKFKLYGQFTGKSLSQSHVCWVKTITATTEKLIIKVDIFNFVSWDLRLTNNNWGV